MFSKVFREQYPVQGQCRFLLVLHQQIIAVHQTVEIIYFLEGPSFGLFGWFSAIFSVTVELVPCTSDCRACNHVPLLSPFLWECVDMEYKNRRKIYFGGNLRRSSSLASCSRLLSLPCLKLDKDVQALTQGSGNPQRRKIVCFSRQVFQCLAMLIVRKFFLMPSWNFSWCYLQLLLFVLSSCFSWRSLLLSAHFWKATTS